MTLTRTELAEGLDWRARTWRRKYAEKDECVGYYSEGYAFFDTQAADALRSADAEIASLRAMLAEAEGALGSMREAAFLMRSMIRSGEDFTPVSTDQVTRAIEFSRATLAALRAQKEKTDA